jgi:hypothetical protein
MKTMTAKERAYAALMLLQFNSMVQVQDIDRALVVLEEQFLRAMSDASLTELARIDSSLSEQRE